MIDRSSLRRAAGVFLMAWALAPAWAASPTAPAAPARPATGAKPSASPSAVPATTAAPGAQATPAPAADVPIKGHAMAIGGALKADNDEVWNRLIALAGGKGARFVVFGTAAEDPEASAKQVVEQLQRRGAIAEALPVAPKFPWVDLNKVVRDPALIAKVRGAKGIFFTGGSQERIVDVLFPGGQSTPMLDAIWDVYRRGGVVAGTSAGAAVMSTVMFRDAPSVISILKGQWEEGKQIDRGLGFVGPSLFVDQHFLKRGRFGRMVPLMLAKGYRLGLGVDENSAAVIRGDEVEILGHKGALLVDLSEASSDRSLGVFNLRNAKLTYLDHGDRMNLRTRGVTPSAIKLRGQKLEPGAPDYKPYYTLPQFYTDMLGDSTISTAMSILIDSVQPEFRGLSFEAAPKAGDNLADLGFLFRLYKGPGSIGWSTDELGPEDYTVVNLYLDVTPVRMPLPLFAPWPGDRKPKSPAPAEEPPAGERPQQQ
ncbi:cyanophycinase [Roseateles sp. So40a]|uniref:cyanophycinase n=1 Tax=Roseateles sp. So40a TaxID=3400226 RepID=UPI003A87823C